MRKTLALVSCLVIIMACNQAKNKASDHPAYHNPTVQPLTDAIAEWPDSAGLYFQRSLALSKINQDSLVLIDLQKAATLMPEKVLYLNAIGYVQMNLGHPDKAIPVFQKSLRITPNDPEIQVQLARAFMNNNQLDDASHTVEQVVRAAPRYLPAYLLQAQLKAAEKDTPAAIQLIAKVLSANSHYYDASMQLADWYKELGDSRAVPQYQQAFALNQEDATPLYEIGRFYQQKNQWEKAKIAYKNCFLQDGDYTSAYINTAEILMQQDSLSKARRVLQIAVATAPANADAWYYTGRCFEKMKEADSARYYYEQAAYFGYDAADIHAATIRLKP